MEFMLADGSQEELNLDSYVSPLSLPGDLDRPRKLASKNTPIQHHQSFIDHTTYTMDSSQSQLSHLVIEPLNIVFVFTNPWTKSSHAVLTFTQQEEKEMWEYMNRLISNKNNRGRIEGGSYMVYALLDYVVRSIALHNIKVDSYVDVLKSFAEEIRQVELTVDKSSSIYQSVLLSRELDSFQNRIQPLLTIISDLQADSVISHRVSIYLNDVKDHVQQLLNDIQYCSNRSNNVYNLVQSMRAKRQDRILLILTLITAFFTPISFLAGVYGMNFDYMPSLHWKFGYLYFWIYSQPQQPFIPQQPQAYQPPFPQQQPTNGLNMPQFSTGYRANVRYGFQSNYKSGEESIGFVSNQYVVGKLQRLLFPFGSKSWKRTCQINDDGSETYFPPRQDVNAPDLYIPLMAIFTYIVTVGFMAGTKGQFSPKIISSSLSACSVAITLELLLLKLILYLINCPVSIFDLLALISYKFVGLCINSIVKLTGIRIAYIASCLYTGIFTTGRDEERKRRKFKNYFVFSTSFSQLLLMWLMGRYMG
ncbi:Mg2+ transporter protein [Blastocystis sp. subtype 4]|uniref:Mg2+ transporter protein n=1 Tax=Blastocystis sp. subtype 4 TaxID=944170 RepID=UPI000712172B|nr:Mg2+ transporter protein [Blastocystis sp. subtype 4]KNB43480.1 Mg2+ transporter protein [Blastocystis sp. subtype 4]|eukprot:XP_014526923.1 Mg2+ transporter protein [Blastocystis sp. subtype 4]